MTRKTLYLLRHAKAETGAPDQDDFDRGLTDRGFANAKSIGKTLVTKEGTPGMVLCSTALRACLTWEGLGLSFPVTYSDKLYLASPGNLLQIIAEMPEEVGMLMLIGHNPGLHQLALALAQSGPKQALDELAVHFPTCAFAAIELDQPWRDISLARGQLVEFLTPRGL